MRCLVSRPFWWPTIRDRAPAEFCQACDQSFIVAKAAVAVEFDKVRKHQIDPVESVRPLGMARNLGALPRAKVSIKLAAEFEALPFSDARPRLSLSSVEARRRNSSTSFSRRSISRWRSSVVVGEPFFSFAQRTLRNPLNRLLTADAADGLLKLRLHPNAFLRLEGGHGAVWRDQFKHYRRLGPAWLQIIVRAGSKFHHSGGLIVEAQAKFARAGTFGDVFQTAGFLEGEAGAGFLDRHASFQEQRRARLQNVFEPRENFRGKREEFPALRSCPESLKIAQRAPFLERMGRGADDQRGGR